MITYYEESPGKFPVRMANTTVNSVNVIIVTSYRSRFVTN